MIKNRLTQRDKQGKWCVKGLPWKDTYEGQVVTRNTREKIYGALRKLYDYEEGGAFYPGDDETSYVKYGIFVNAWMPLPRSYKTTNEVIT